MKTHIILVFILVLSCKLEKPKGQKRKRHEYTSTESPTKESIILSLDKNKTSLCGLMLTGTTLDNGIDLKEKCLQGNNNITLLTLEYKRGQKPNTTSKRLAIKRKLILIKDQEVSNNSDNYTIEIEEAKTATSESKKSILVLILTNTTKARLEAIQDNIKGEIEANANIANYFAIKKPALELQVAEIDKVKHTDTIIKKINANINNIASEDDKTLHVEWKVQ